jgi:hypothetical protein
VEARSMFGSKGKTRGMDEKLRGMSGGGEVGNATVRDRTALPDLPTS